MPFTEEVLADFIGSGITFPIQLENGKAKISTGFTLVDSSIRNAISWPLGTRWFLGEYGSEIHRLLDEPNTTKVEITLERFFKDVISKWVSQVEQLDVSVEQDPKIAAKINIKVVYRLLNTPQPQTLIYPFYRNIPY